jgi:hypothetical protein
VKNLRKHWNEYERAKLRYETRKTQEKRQRQKKDSKSQVIAKQARLGIRGVDTQAGC